MQAPVSRSWRLPDSANSAFAGLLLLAGFILASLIGLLLWQGPVLIQGVWLACQDALGALRGAWPALGLALPVLLLVVGLLLAGYSMAEQLWHTRHLVGDLRSRRQPVPAGLARMVLRLNLAGRLELVADEQPYTFAQGLIRPKIWLSSGLLDLLNEAELQAVLRHERHHVRQRDPLRVLFSRTLARLLFFLPLAGLLRDAFLVAKEVEADEASGADEHLASALLKLLQRDARLPEEANLAAIGPVDATSARLDRLLKQSRLPRKPAGILWRQLAISLLLGLVLALTSFFSMVRAAQPLDGGKCGYSIPAMHLTNEWPVTPMDFTPASSSVY